MQRGPRPKPDTRAQPAPKLENVPVQTCLWTHVCECMLFIDFGLSLLYRPVSALSLLYIVQQPANRAPPHGKRNLPVCYEKCKILTNSMHSVRDAEAGKRLQQGCNDVGM